MITAEAIRIEAEPARPLTVAKRAAVLRAAVAAAPLSARLRGDLADHLMTLERFADVIDLVEHWPDGGNCYRAQMVLAACRLVPNGRAENALAYAAADRAIALAASPSARADALALRAKAERRLGKPDVARETLAAALAEDPANIDACKRLAALMVAAGEETGVLALTDGLLARGVAHPQVLNARAVAQARLGQIDAARETVGFARFAYQTTLPTPPGFADLAAFNAAVATELLAHPARRTDPHGSASRFTTRVDTPTSGRAPLATMLVEQITRAVAAYVDALAPDPHPWRGARPAAGIVHGTCAITGPDGFETWHIHQRGWLSGVYYLAVPDAVTAGTTPAGCIAFGLDDAFAGVAAAEAYGETLVRPRPGMLMLFPSHCYHRTFAHGADGLRICMAFDLWPR